MAKCVACGNIVDATTYLGECYECAEKYKTHEEAVEGEPVEIYCPNCDMLHSHYENVGDAEKCRCFMCGCNPNQEELDELDTL